MKSETVSRFQRSSLLVTEYFEASARKVQMGRITRENNAPYNQLMVDAQESLTVAPLSVTEKLHIPPSGDKRDYFSLSIYFWPNEKTTDGLPYVPRDGVINPEIHEYDRPRFVEMCAHVDTLSVAFALSADERFAAKAAELLRTWFIDEHTRMNPNMLFAQYIPGDNVEVPWKDYPARYVSGTGERPGVFVSYGGVIEDHHLIPLTDCIKLLRPSEHWSAADDEAMLAWYAAYTAWLLTHQHGLDEAACRNNHGSWYWADILCFLNFIGQPERAREYAAQMFPLRLQMQIEPDGSQPEELGRAISQHYTAFTLCSFTNMALSAQECGYDAWSVQADDGRSLAKAIDWFLPYLTGEQAWQWKQIKPFHTASVIGLLSACAYGYGQPKYRSVMARFPDLAAGHRARLLYDFDSIEQ
jgi:hypothetical protein